MKGGERLLCLDVLRGLDMFFYLVLAGCLRSLGEWLQWPSWWGMQFEHLPWQGLTAYDYIAPVFVFVSGGAVVFGVERRLDANGRPTAAFWRHMASRTALLWLLGMIMLGGLLSFDPLKMHPYFCILEIIAVVNIAVSLTLLVKNRIFRLSLPFVLMAVYSLILHFGGDYSPEGNIAMRIERIVLEAGLPAGNTWLQPGGLQGFAMILPTLMEIAMGLLGMNAVAILRSGASSRRKLLCLGVAGLAFVVMGAFFQHVIGLPAIKRLCTLPYTGYTIGVALWLLALLYSVNDVLGIRRGFGVLELFGRNSLFCYMVGSGELRWGLIMFAKKCLYGCPVLFGVAPQLFIEAVGHSALLVYLTSLWQGAKEAKRLKRKAA